MPISLLSGIGLSLPFKLTDCLALADIDIGRIPDGIAQDFKLS
jgi:hypothetical protein